MTSAGLRYRAPALVYAALLFWASSRSRLPLPDLGWPLEDKLLHALAYAVLSWLVYLALTRPRRIVGHPHIWSVVLCATYAATDEWHQVLVPGRVPDTADFAADLVGLAAVQLILWLRSHPFRSRAD